MRGRKREGGREREEVRGRKREGGGERKREGGREREEVRGRKREGGRGREEVRGRGNTLNVETADCLHGYSSDDGGLEVMVQLAE